VPGLYELTRLRGLYRVVLFTYNDARDVRLLRNRRNVVGDDCRANGRDDHRSTNRDVRETPWNTFCTTVAARGAAKYSNRRYPDQPFGFPQCPGVEKRKFVFK